MQAVEITLQEAVRQFKKMLLINYFWKEDRSVFQFIFENFDWDREIYHFMDLIRGTRELTHISCFSFACPTRKKNSSGPPIFNACLSTYFYSVFHTLWDQSLKFCFVFCWFDVYWIGGMAVNHPLSCYNLPNPSPVTPRKNSLKHQITANWLCTFRLLQVLK